MKFGRKYHSAIPYEIPNGELDTSQGEQTNKYIIVSGSELM